MGDDGVYTTVTTAAIPGTASAGAATGAVVAAAAAVHRQHGHDEAVQQPEVRAPSRLRRD